ncbi:predicted unusual protein kinase [Longilinea arvoryzae]|uniref:Predicted unusual protein kinase n=1 Tax=Longilinea arvoryzae TaxID=360412 RepID=A0A0S7BC88_9CHLR|nr:AarF/ABC1/UbiB kinase family protein [Longilinea arvoryzae]GAP15484.1 predicted unusual protein kinase [Longilinea arvoryzae]
MTTLYQSRYRRILWFFARVLLNVGFWDVFLPWLRLPGPGRRSQKARYRGIAVRFRVLAVDLGGVMIKVGQFLSARLDVLPREITDELSGLQDEVKAEAFADIRTVAESELGKPLSELFTLFEEEPVASASIGQVHRARLHLSEDEAETDRPVVVKVQRPNIPQIVETDLAALRVVGGWVEHFRFIRKHVDVPALLVEFSRSLYEEIDYLHEGQNAERFAGNFAGYAGVYVPRVYWETTTKRVLTLEDVQAIKITDYERIDAAGIDRGEVAQRLFQTYMKQIYDDHFFHADPHPGNLFVHPQAVREGQTRPEWLLVFVDFGMTGEVTPGQMKGLRELLIAVGTRDAARIVKAYQMLGVLLPGADIELLQRAGSRVFDRFWGMTAPEITNLSKDELFAFLHEFESLIYEMPFQVPENIVLLVRCLSILSGLCTGLDQDFNAWTSVGPFAQKLVAEEGGSRLQTWLAELGVFAQALFSLPQKMERLAARMEQGNLEVRVPEVKRGIDRLNQNINRLSGAVIFAALLLSAVQFYAAGDLTLAGLFASLAALTLVWVIWPR